MAPEQSGTDSAVPGEGEPLIFMSDASAEAERLSGALRARGYPVVDVPLALLLNRVAVQRPSLIVCDVDAPDALGTIGRLRDVPRGNRVDVVFIGESGRTLETMRDAVAHESSGVFVRPVDPHGLVRKVEALIGPPAAKGSMAASLSMPPRRPGVLVASTRKPYRYDGQLSRQQIGGETVQAAPNTAPVSEAPRDSGRGELDFDPATKQVGRRASLTPHAADPVSSRSEPPRSAPRSDPYDFSAPLAPGVARSTELPFPQASVSRELKSLLDQAEQRVADARPSSSPPSSGRLSPQEEVDAILPPDVLAALDEPLDLDDEDDELGSEARQGTHSGDGNRTGSGRSPESSSIPYEGRASTTGGSFEPTLPPPAPSARGGSKAPGALSGAGGSTSVRPPNELDTHPPPGSASPSVAPPSAPSAPEASPASHRASASPPPELVERAEPQVLVRAPSEALREPEAARLSEPAPGSDGAPDAEPDVPTPREPAAQRAERRSEQPISPSEQPASVWGMSGQTPQQLKLSGEAAIGQRQSEPPPSRANFEVPPSLSRGDAVTTLARAIRSHYTGALAFEDGRGIRRVVFRDGDFVTAASGIDGESLVSFLAQRGDIKSEAAAPLERKLPPFGRHAGAALIAHGHLQQDELWPVLRSHAEWLLTHIVGIEQGGASLEVEVPGRLQAEPAVFGGAAGAEVLVEVVRRVVSAEEAVARLGGRNSVLEKGRSVELLAECALGPEDAELVRDIDGVPLDRLMAGAKDRDVLSVLYALTELGVLAARAASPHVSATQENYEPDALDEEALRTRVAARMALVQEGDYFSLLGLARSATNYEVERAYIELRRQFDPERLRSLATPELYDQLALIVEVLDEAYEILRDQRKRERYRRALDAAPFPPGVGAP